MSYSEFKGVDVIKRRLRGPIAKAKHNISLTHSPRVWKTPVSFPNKLDKLLGSHRRNAQVIMSLKKKKEISMKRRMNFRLRTCLSLELLFTGRI